MNDGGQAFPTKGKTFHANKAEYCNNVYTIKMAGGMSLRDWYKGMALQSGLCPVNTYMWGDIAEWCGHMADAMIEEWEK